MKHNMGKKQLWIPLLAVGIIILQSFCLPIKLHRFVRDFEEFDVYEYDSTFAGWSLDSLRRLSDTLINEISVDSLPIEWILLNDSPDSLQAALDSLANVMFLRDSTIKAKIELEKWLACLPRAQRRKWIQENIVIPKQIRMADSIYAVKDSIQNVKDSIVENTPRILESKFIPDSLYYKRLLLMTRDTRFGDIKFHEQDTSYNYHFYDYDFMHKDVGANWQGVAGSAVQYYNYNRRDDLENAIFFTPYATWSHTPDDLPMFNTKTPYTELAYWGTLLSGQNKEEINLKLLTTQNITPAFNITFNLDKFGGAGVLQNETTQSYNLGLSGSYLGRRYSMHTGWIHSKLTRLEDGGITDNFWIRDTTVDSKEIGVNLSKAENAISKNSLFINQTLRIPFGKDSLTTAFVGHTTIWTLYDKKYSDQISTDEGRAFYHNVFNINSSSSADTMRVSNLDNRLYLRLQPWKDDSFISKIDVGVGDKLLSYYDFYKDSLSVYSGKTVQNNLYGYAGAHGMIRQYFNWDADAKLHFLGHQAGDFNINANAYFNFYPFRKARKSPVSLSAHFHTDLMTPDHYQQRLLVNHNSWDNSFGKQSTMRFGGALNIPYWKLSADVFYTLRGNALYYNETGVSSQYEGSINVLSASLRKEFVLWKFHFDNRVLFQLSSNQQVAPMPLLAFNLRYFIEFTVVKNAMDMQIGANALYTTNWATPRFNPNVGVFYNQNTQYYGSTPYIDAFVNIQWKRASIFIKVENVNQGWPDEYGKDYFCGDGYIHAQRTVKLGIHWPFYIKPAHTHGKDPLDMGAKGNPAKQSAKK